jgi:predicted dehydrogenase
MRRSVPREENAMNRREFMTTSLIAGVGASVARDGFAGQSTPANRIAVGLIGSGARGQDLLQSSMKIPGVEFVAVCDAYQGRMTRARARTNGRAAMVPDYRQILERKDVDAVIIASPDHWHKAMTIEALQAGKDIYIEKPLTYTIDEGQQIVDAVRKSGRLLQVGSQVISSATVAKARDMIRAGRLGQITLVRATYNRNTAEGAWIYPIPPDASERTVNWDQFLGPAPKRPFSLERFFRWRCYWDYSGGIATDLFVHLVTTIHHLMDAKMPRHVIASGELYRWKESREVPDTVNAILLYPEGFTVNLSSTFNNTSESGYEIFGTEASLAIRGGTLTFAPENAYDNNRWVVESWPEELEKAYYADPKVQARETPSTWKPEMRENREIWNERGQDAMFVHLSRFFDSVRTRTAPIEDAGVGHRAAAVAHLVNQALREKKPLEWDSERGTARRSA